MTSQSAVATRSASVESEATPCPRTAGPGPGATWRPWVLLVEDEEIQAEVLATHLTRAGYRVTTARDGWEALHATLQAAPSVVLLDLGLPRLNGYGLLEELRSREHTRSVPVLVVTGNPSLDVDDRVVPFNVAGILLKPVDTGRLLERVAHLLEPS